MHFVAQPFRHEFSILVHLNGVNFPAVFLHVSKRVILELNPSTFPSPTIAKMSLCCEATVFVEPELRTINPTIYPATNFAKIAVVPEGDMCADSFLSSLKFSAKE